MNERPAIDAATLLTELQAAGHVSPEAAPLLIATMDDPSLDDEPPLHLKILTAVGTFLGTTFFLAFLALSKLVSFDSGSSLLVLGGVVLGGGVAASWWSRGLPSGMARDFTAQSAFVAMALGKILVVAGAVIVWDERGHTLSITAAALFVVTLVSYPVSGSSLDRLLSPYATAIAVLYALVERTNDASTVTTVFHLASSIVAAVLLLPARVPPVLRPIGLAALAVSGTVVVILVTGRDMGFLGSYAAIDPRPIEAILTLSLVGTIVFAAGGPSRLASPPVTTAIVGAIALGFAGAPGLLFALILLIAGHALHDTPLRVVGILALPVFIALWYWERDMTLLAKSAALVGSGALLLAARGGMAFAGWDREDAA